MERVQLSGSVETPIVELPSIVENEAGVLTTDHAVGSLASRQDLDRMRSLSHGKQMVGALVAPVRETERAASRLDVMALEGSDSPDNPSAVFP